MPNAKTNSPQELKRKALVLIGLSIASAVGTTAVQDIALGLGVLTVTLTASGAVLAASALKLKKKG